MKRSNPYIAPLLVIVVIVLFVVAVITYDINKTPQTRARELFVECIKKVSSPSPELVASCEQSSKNLTGVK